MVAIVVVAAAPSAAGAYALNDNGHEGAAPSAAGRPRGRGSAAPTTTLARARSRPRRCASSTTPHPLKLWVGGDSLAGSFGPALGDQVGATGVVEDPRRLQGVERAVEQRPPQLGRAGDRADGVRRIPTRSCSSSAPTTRPIVNKVDANGDGVPDWEVEYRLKVAEMMDLLVGADHRTVFWLGPPTLGTRSTRRAAPRRSARSCARRRPSAPPTSTYLDTYKLFSTTDGDYSRHILDENGNEITARIGDGVHFTEDGAEYLARAVFKLIDARWHMTEPGRPAGPDRLDARAGSGESVPGFSSKPRSRYRSGNSSGSNNNSSPTTTGQSTDSTVAVRPRRTVSDTPTTAVAADHASDQRDADDPRARRRRPSPTPHYP